MRKYAAFRILFTVLLMQLWVLLSYLHPSGVSRFLPWVGWLWAVAPLYKIRPKSHLPLSSRIAVGLAIIGISGIVIRLFQLLHRDHLDPFIALFFGLIAIAWGLHSWSWIIAATNRRLVEVFGSCLGAAAFQKANPEPSPTDPPATGGEPL